MKRDSGVCGTDGHQVRHTVRADTGERVHCIRTGCDLDVTKPDGQPCLVGAYRTWDGPQGLLEGVDRAEA